MKVIVKSLHLIDTESEVVEAKSYPQEFEKFIVNLTKNFSVNENVRKYKTKTLDTVRWVEF